MSQIVDKITQIEEKVQELLIILNQNAKITIWYDPLIDVYEMRIHDIDKMTFILVTISLKQIEKESIELTSIQLAHQYIKYTKEV